MREEMDHFNLCKEVIRENIRNYEKKTAAEKKETESLFAAVAAGEVELYNQLIVSKDILAHNENVLRKNRAALQKPYFGRVDYTETGNGQSESLYIGKNGVARNRTDVLIVDWRAPVSTIYYENELGEGSYEVPEVGKVRVDLKRKRTFDINDGMLLGYYDNDTAATDELLVRYLAQNKDVILGDIISTIQKEQNEIIRESPYCDIIVQGVAGSGKTTVAMHRISYILYNYEQKFAPGEFCIIGSNDMLLNYITSGLPELDVHDVGQKRMDLFFCDLLERENKKEFPKIFGRKAGQDPFAVSDTGQDFWKSRMEFILALEAYLKALKAKLLPVTDVTDEKLGVILPAASIADTLRENPEFSIVQLQKLLNERLQKRINFLMTEEERTEKKKAAKSRYKGYYKMQKSQCSILKIYEEFLAQDCLKWGQEEVSLPVPGTFGIYDLAALVLIWKRVTAKVLPDDYGQVIIDEAQDFGAMVYYVLKQVLYQCHFTIMGDVSQNIHYQTGMNSWEELQQVFTPEQLRFHILSKSYRNTIEISECAGKILEKASCGAYRITPVIRHGRPVEFHRVEDDEAVLKKTAEALILGIKERGYDTIAIICRNDAEADAVRNLLGLCEAAADMQDFGKCVMVLPIQLTKGLEFDAVLLWNPSSEAYLDNEGDAKLLYVAVTRALHELHILHKEELSPLFEGVR